jgi:hypothetical protein
LWFELACQCDRFGTAACLANDMHVGFVLEHAPEAASHETVVIYKKNGNFRVRHE